MPRYLIRMLDLEQAVHKTGMVPVDRGVVHVPDHLRESLSFSFEFEAENDDHAKQIADEAMAEAGVKPESYAVVPARRQR